MRVVSAAVLAAAALATSVTAASLDVEPTTTAPMLQVNTNSSSNATSDGKIGTQWRSCDAMKKANWDDFKYACSWSHHRRYYDDSYYDWYNLFFMRWDGSVVYECDCNWDLRSYDPWGSRWAWSRAQGNQVECYTRDGKHARDALHAFDAYTCF